MYPCSVFHENLMTPRRSQHRAPILQVRQHGQRGHTGSEAAELEFKACPSVSKVQLLAAAFWRSPTHGMEVGLKRGICLLSWGVTLSFSSWNRGARPASEVVDFGKIIVPAYGSRGHVFVNGVLGGGMQCSIGSCRGWKEGWHSLLGTELSVVFNLDSLWSIRKYYCRTTILDGAVSLQWIELDWAWIVTNQGQPQPPRPAVVADSADCMCPALQSADAGSSSLIFLFIPHDNHHTAFPSIWLRSHYPGGLSIGMPGKVAHGHEVGRATLCGAEVAPAV